MRLHPVVRDLALVGIAVSVGWWLRDAGTAVLAQRSNDDASSSTARGGDGLAFQLSGVGPGASLTVYNAANHTLYVYPSVGLGNSHINCQFSLTVSNPGAPIDRQNCPIGSRVPRR